MASQVLADALEATGFLSGGKPAAGVRLGEDALDNFLGRDFSPNAVWTSESGLTVYFKDAPSLPSADEVAKWRRVAWNRGFAPLLWVISPNRIDLYNGFARPLDVGDADATRLDTFECIDQELERLDATAGRLAIETGTFWEKPLARDVDRSARVDRQLLSDLANLEQVLLDDGLPRPDAQALIGRSIFAQFLFDRGILKIPEPLTAHLRQPDTARRLFDWLSKTFNGDMFPAHTAVPQDVHLHHVADFLEAVDPQTKQTTLFPYQFDIIPVEVISSIYEQFAQAANVANGGAPTSEVNRDVFYTPIPLVSMVLDEVTDGITGEETVLDLTCGSAVFLVEALRRLVRSRGQKEDMTGKIVRTVLHEQIYGVDISEAALRVAAFSLYLAALELDPNLVALKLDLHEEGTVVPFRPLIGRNLIVGDAWDKHEALTIDGEPRKFDLVVGNPPWSDPGKGTRAERRMEAGKESVQTRGDSINFANRALKFTAPHTRIGLVLSANQFFAQRKGEPTPAQRLVASDSLSPMTLVNLSSLRRWLFPNSELPAMVLFARHRKAPSETITTVHVPWSPSSARTSTIEISPSDVLAISKSAFRRNRHVLKAAFLGKRRDLALLERLATDHPRLADELRRLETAIRSGLKGAGRGKEGNAKHLQGYPFLNNDAWKAGEEIGTTLFSLPSHLPEFAVAKAAKPRKAENFRAPLVLLKENLLKESPRPVVLMADDDIVYSDAFHGIAFSKGHARAAAILAATLRSSLATWYLLMTSANFGAWKQRIKIQDVNMFPAPDLMASPKTEQGRHLVALVRRLRRRKSIGEVDQVALDKAVFDLYGLRDQERAVIRDGVVRARWQWEGWRDESAEEVSIDHLVDYASVFLDVMEDWLRSAGARRMKAEIFDLPAGAPLQVVRFVLEEGAGPSPAPEVVVPNGTLREVLDRLGTRLQVRLGDMLYGQRELRVHGRAEVVVIKPNVRRHWMAVCALEDADAVIVESWAGRNP